MVVLYYFNITFNIIFQDLLSDLDVWHEAPGELLRSHLEHLYELAAESSEKRNNIWVMRDLQLVDKLLYITPDVKHQATRQVLFSLLTILLGGQPRHVDLLWFGQFLAATLSLSATPSEKCVDLDDETDTIRAQIVLRNRCLGLMHSLLFARNSVSLMVCDEIARTLGFDWILLFMQPHLHSTTVIWALRTLIVMCSIPALMNR